MPLIIKTFSENSRELTVSDTKRVVVLLSGNGSNVQALLDKQSQYGYQVIGVISNRPDAHGLERARRHRVAAIPLDHKIFSSREAFDRRLQEEVERFDPDLVVLAGYMRILSPDFVHRFSDRLINIHPSLLPLYRGLDTYRRVLEDRQPTHGTTIHYVTNELDNGAHIIQAELAITSADNERSLRQRVQAMEHCIYPRAVDLIASGRMTLKEQKVWFDNRPLNPEGYQVKEDNLEIP